MRYTFVTLFPNIIEGYFSDSILKRAIDKNLITIDFINPRDFAKNKHKKTDDTAFSGGAGMLMTPQPLFDALTHIQQSSPNAHFIFLTPVAKQFVQNDAKRIAKKEHVVFVSGRYEGIDERIIELFADELFSIGDYILTGGELPSMVLCDAISRNVDGVLGNSESLTEESFENALLEAPSFTKPQNFKEIFPPSEFLKGNHSKIRSLKFALSKVKTKYFRPEQYKRAKSLFEKQ
jgi:tRNA (guanine37-N1)-methyltransferase